MNYLYIGELAEKTNSKNETLRFYESKGLLEPARRSHAGYRLYAEQAVARVNFIVRAKQLGFSLKEIAELLSLRVSRHTTTCGEVKALAEQKLANIEAKIKELTRMQLALDRIITACGGGDESAVHCTILDQLDKRLL